MLQAEVTLVHRIVKEVVSFLNIATCNHNLGLQIKTVEVAHPRTDRVSPGFGYV